MKAYLFLEMLVAESAASGDEEACEDLRDVMDGLWLRLSTDEQMQLDKRKL